tara:strand:+ start:159 stop:530 length:372 start_codon:yes stop_codon:yes gene_type:complete
MKIEVSNGEIVDKLTILEIKLRNSDCDKKSKQIVKEMMYLSPIVGELNVPIEMIDNLRVVNQKLWDVEDALRVHEYNKDFGDEFVKLARSVYHTNDARFYHKSVINDLTNSDLTEEKILPQYK